MKIKFTVPCPESLLDVAQFDDNSAVVLYGSSFQFTCIKPGIMFQEKSPINWACYALESMNRVVYISGYDCDRKKYGVAGFSRFTGQITHFVDLIGSEMQSLCSYLSLHIERDTMYYIFIGRSKNSYFINKLSSSGHGIFSTCTTALKKPKSIICDNAGNMLICDTDTKSVHIVDLKGKVGHTVLTEKDDFGPTSMCLNASKDTLIVASSQKDSSKITVYSLHYD